MLSLPTLERLLTALGALLESFGLAYSIVVVGGSALVLRGLVVRPTQDLDVVALEEDGVYRKAEPLPYELAEAARDVAIAAGVPEDWLNTIAADVMNEPGLPAGFAERTDVLTFGALRVLLASRFDLICLKLHAAVDRAPASKHLDDLRLLRPTGDELIKAGRWACTHDPSPGFRGQLIALLQMFGVDDAGQRV